MIKARRYRDVYKAIRRENGQKRKYGAENRFYHRDFKAVDAADDEGGNRAEERNSGVRIKGLPSCTAKRGKADGRGKAMAGNSVNYLYQSLKTIP